MGPPLVPSDGNLDYLGKNSRQNLQATTKTRQKLDPNLTYYRVG